MSDEAKETPEFNEEQAELVRRYNLAPEDVKRVRGESWAEKCEDAKRLADLAEPQSIRERARRHLRELQEHPNAGELLAIAAGKNKREWSRQFLESMHRTEDESEPAMPEGPVNFDGGARESEPPPADPIRDHNEIIAEMARAKELEGW